MIKLIVEHADQKLEIQQDKEKIALVFMDDELPVEISVLTIEDLLDLVKLRESIKRNESIQMRRKEQA